MIEVAFNKTANSFRVRMLLSLLSLFKVNEKVI